MFKYSIFPLLLAMSGCGALIAQQYQSPTEGDLAYLLINPIDSRTLAAITYEVPATCTKRRMLNAVISNPETITIQANEDISITFK